MSRVQVPPKVALLFLLRKREWSSGVVALLCLVSMTDPSCMYMYMYMYIVLAQHMGIMAHVDVQPSSLNF